MKKNKVSGQSAPFVQGKTLELSRPVDLQTLNQKYVGPSYISTLQSMR